MLVLYPICDRWSLYVYSSIPSFLTAILTNSPVQIIGYICRVIAYNNLSSVPIYAMQSVLILLAPPLYAASVYMVLGRLVRYLHAEDLSLVPVKWMTKIFVSGDVFSFLLQAGGKHYLHP